MTSPRPRPGILEIRPYVGGKSRVAGHAPLAKLSSNENALGPSPRALEAYRSAASALHRYPDGQATALRAAIARQHNVEPRRIAVGAGSDELIALLVRAYAGPGDEVLHSAHGFLMYRLSALAAGAHPVAAPERQLTADVDALLAHVTSRTRLVFLANPNNPTGTYLPAAEIRRLHAGLPDDVILVLDAAYAEFARAADYDPGQTLSLEAPNVVILRTFSKIHGLAALRVGWMTGSDAILDVIDRIRGPFNTAQPAQDAASAAIADLDHQAASRAHNDRWLGWLADELTALGLEVVPSQGNFLLLGLGTAERAAAAEAELEAQGVIPRAMGSYGLPAHLRLSVGTEAENRAAVAAFARFVQGCRAA